MKIARGLWLLDSKKAVIRWRIISLLQGHGYVFGAHWVVKAKTGQIPSRSFSAWSNRVKIDNNRVSDVLAKALVGKPSIFHHLLRWIVCTSVTWGLGSVSISLCAQDKGHRWQNVHYKRLVMSFISCCKNCLPFFSMSQKTTSLHFPRNVFWISVFRDGSLRFTWPLWWLNKMGRGRYINPSIYSYTISGIFVIVSHIPSVCWRICHSTIHNIYYIKFYISWEWGGSGTCLVPLSQLSDIRDTHFEDHICFGSRLTK